jgi:D-tyrosyl-tRNA(Tyr) deacylase
MRAVVQRVDRASVRVDGATVGEIHGGLLIFLSVGIDDDEAAARTMADKISELRIFSDDRGLMNRSIQQNGGAVLLVSQFTLHGDVRRGRRPSFAAAAKEPQARELYERVGRALEARGLTVAYGRFGARMDVELVNTGPVTILVDTQRAF